MEVNLGLFEDNDGAARHIEALDDYRQHLAHAESDIGKLDRGGLRPRLHEDFVLLAMLPERTDLKVVNEAHLAQAFRDHLLQWLLRFRPEIKLPIAGGKNRLDRTVAALANMLWNFTRPQVEALRVLPQGTNIEDALEHPFEFEHEIRGERGVLIIRLHFVREAVEAEWRRQWPRAALDTPEIGRAPPRVRTQTSFPAARSNRALS